MKASGYLLIGGVLGAIVLGCFAGEPGILRQDNRTKAVVEGNNGFAFGLYAKLRGKEGNLFLSPYSISTALAMTQAGAGGGTAHQMAEVLNLPGASGRIVPQEVHTAFGKVIKDLNSRGKKGAYELRVANALWGQKGYDFLEEYLGLVEKYYDGRLAEVDFIGATEAARKTINAWVEKKTNDKIKELIRPGVLSRMTRLVLTNAIYFKGKWENQFEENMTRPGPFSLEDGRKVDVPMMNQTDQFGYMEADGFQGIELPYVDNDLSMIILLPRRVGGLSDFEKTLTAENLSKWLGKLRKRRVIVTVPKFKMTSQFSLASVLKSMGMTDAFVPNAADFSGINGKKDLFISAVIHKAFVEVSEEGTEAAAATGVVIGVTSVGPGQTPVFRADRPFVFLIRDNHTGSILFIGRVMNPATEG